MDNQQQQQQQHDNDSCLQQQQDEPDTVQAQQQKKGGWPKGKRRRGSKVLKDVNAPRTPLTGYVRYMNDRRDKARMDYPDMSFADLTKLMGTEWTHLPREEKQKYLEEAEKDKERYLNEIESYQQTDSYKRFNKKQKQELAQQQRAEEEGSRLNGNEEEEKGYDVSAFDVPIFTEEFLNHNKAREAELRQLRKSNVEYEEQNSILAKHIDNMKSAVEKLEVDALQQRQHNIALQQHLDALRTTLTTNFTSIPLPGSGELASIDNIDAYMAKLHNIIVEAPQDHEGLINTVRDIVTRIDLQIIDPKL